MIGLIIIGTIFVIGCIGMTESETTFQIGKFDISKSNISTYEYDVHYNTMSIDIDVVNITQTELDNYPVLEKEISKCGNKIGYYSICKVSKDEWHKIKNFIDSKRDKSKRDNNKSSCFRFDDKYGEYCYQFNFIRP